MEEEEEDVYNGPEDVDELFELLRTDSIDDKDVDIQLIDGAIDKLLSDWKRCEKTCYR